MSESTLSPEFVQDMKEKLEERRHVLKKDLSRLEQDTLESNKEASGDLSSMPIHSADVGTDTYERNQNIGELQREQKELDKIQHALDKIEGEVDADYGVCEECEEWIDPERLRAIPYTPHCIDCAKKVEEQESGPS